MRCGSHWSMSPRLVPCSPHSNHVKVALPPSLSYRWHNQGSEKLSNLPQFTVHQWRKWVIAQVCLTRGTAFALTKPLGGDGSGLPALQGLCCIESSDDPTKSLEETELKNSGTLQGKGWIWGHGCPQHYAGISTCGIWARPVHDCSHRVVTGLNEAHGKEYHVTHRPETS